jgi:hypothetical protein
MKNSRDDRGESGLLMWVWASQLNDYMEQGWELAWYRWVGERMVCLIAIRKESE